MTTIVCLGDSNMALGWVSDAANQAYGLSSCISSLAGDRITKVSNVAVGGTSSLNLQSVEGGNPAQVTAAIATGADWAFILTGSNDAVAEVTAATVVDNIKDACQALKSAGMKVMVMTPLVRSDATAVAVPASGAIMSEIGARLLAVPNLLYWDAIVDLHSSFPEWSDGTTVHYDVSNGGVANEGVHPNTKGSILIAKRVISAFEPLIPLHEYANLYDNNDEMLGNNGLIDPAFTGEMPTGWGTVGSALAGVTGALAVETAAKQDGTPTEQIRLEISGTPTSGFGYIIGPAISVASGVTCRARARIRTSGDMAGLVACSMSMANAGGAVAEGFKTSGFTEFGLIPPNSDLIIWSPPYLTTGVEAMNPQLEIGFQDGVATAGALTISEVQIVSE